MARIQKKDGFIQTLLDAMAQGLPSPICFRGDNLEMAKDSGSQKPGLGSTLRSVAKMRFLSLLSEHPLDATCLVGVVSRYDHWIPGGPLTCLIFCERRRDDEHLPPKCCKALF